MATSHLKSYIAVRESRYEQLSRDYDHVIREAIAAFGGAAPLSRALGVNERYIANALNSRGVGSGFKTKRQISLRIAALTAA